CERAALLKMPEHSVAEPLDVLARAYGVDASVILVSVMGEVAREPDEEVRHLAFGQPGKERGCALPVEPRSYREDNVTPQFGGLLKQRPDYGPPRIGR